METGNMETGQLGTGKWSHARWCTSCAAYHGLLYICPSYPEDLKYQLQQEGELFKSDLRDPDWCQQQIDNGAPPEVIPIMRMFAGVD